MSSEPEPLTCRPIYGDRAVGNRLMVFGLLMFLLFLASASFILFKRTEYPQGSMALAGSWIVGVPTYFFIEHVFLFRRYGDPQQYEQFKRVQDLAAKVWAGAIVVLITFFAGKL